MHRSALYMQGAYSYLSVKVQICGIRSVVSTCEQLYVVKKASKTCATLQLRAVISHARYCIFVLLFCTKSVNGDSSHVTAVH